jgi:hypothetical protein
MILTSLGPKMAYQERGSGPPHFDGKNYQMWQRRMAAFLRGKGQILWDVTVNTSYVHPGELSHSRIEGHVRRQQQGGRLPVP